MYTLCSTEGKAPTWTPMGRLGLRGWVLGLGLTIYNFAYNPSYNPPIGLIGVTPIISRLRIPGIRSY